MVQRQKPLPEWQRANPLQLTGGNNNKGRIALNLAREMAKPAQPSLFDDENILDVDKKMMDLLKQADAKLNIQRRGKAVVMNSLGTRVTYALSYWLSLEMDAEDIKSQLAGFNESSIRVTRVVSVAALSKFIFGSQRKREKELIIKEIMNLSMTRQVLIIGSGNNKKRLTAPLILVGTTMEDLSPNKDKDCDFIELHFCPAFFYRLNDRYSLITPKLFEVWRKYGKGSELFDVLTSILLGVHPTHKFKAKRAAAQARREHEGKCTDEELKAIVDEARRNAMVFVIDVSTIKERVTTKYDSNPNMKRKFWKQLDNAIQGFKEYGIIIDAQTSKKGKRGQEQISFLLNYNYARNTGGGNNALILEAK